MDDMTNAEAPASANEELRPAATLPDGDYAIVEILGHRTLIGRVSEVERFGTKLLQVEPVFADELLTAVLIGGGSLYAFTPCMATVAAARQARKRWQLPASLVATLPPEALPAPDDVDDVAEPIAERFEDGA